MSKKKKILLIVISSLIVLLISGVVVARVAFDTDVFQVISEAFDDLIERIKYGKIHDAENTYDPYYESFCDAENDPGVKIDGKLDDDIWKNKDWFKDTFLSTPSSKMPKWKVTSHISEYGFYVAAVIDDTNLVNDGQHTMESNSALELYYFRANVGEKVSGGSLDRGYFAIDMRGDVHGTTGKFKRAVTVKGKLNSGNTKSATIEMFFPWKFLGIDTSKGIPDTIYLYPVYCAVMSGKDSISTSVASMDTVIKPELWLYKDYWRFGKDGYLTADSKNSIVGNSSIGLAKTGNWNLSEEKNGIIRSENGSRAHYAYFKDAYYNDFIVESTIVPIKEISSESKAGFYLITGDGQYHLTTLGMPNSILVDGIKGTKNISKYVLSTYNSKKALYQFYPDSQVPNPNISKKEGVKLTLVKQGKNLWYFADGKFMGTEELDYMNTDVYPALFSWSADVKFKDYSCEQIDKSDVQKYLNDHGVYLINAKVKGGGGKVEASTSAVVKGQKYSITVTSNSGYAVKSILINGKERIADARKNAKDGIYTIVATAENQEIQVIFEKCNGSKLSGFVKGSGNNIPAHLTVTSTSNGILRYSVNADKNKGYSVIVPKGKYKLFVEAEDFISTTVNVNVNKDTNFDIVLKPSMFASKVDVNGKKVSSNASVWDRSREAQGIVTGSFNMGTSLNPLYFAKTGKAARFSSTIRYSTNFVQGGSYQSDLLGGLSVSDGIHSGWFGVRQHGIVYNMEWIEHVIPYDVLSKWDKSHLTVDVEILLVDGNFHIYVDGVYATKLPVSKVINASYNGSDLALGLIMHAEQMADIEFSNIQFSTNEKEVKSLFAKKQAAYTIPAGTLFAQEVTVNGVKIQSVPYRFDLTNIRNNKVSCKNGINNQPLLFKEVAKSALVQTKVTRLDDKTATNRETQPMAGIRISDGTHSGYIGVRANSIVVNDAWYEHVLSREYFVTWTADTNKPAMVDFLVKDNKVQIYIDGIFAKEIPLSTVVPGIKNNSTVAVGLVTESSGKFANIDFSDIKFTTDASRIAAYVDSKDPTKAIPSDCIFTGRVAVNGRTIDSVVPVWDITNIRNNTVIGNNGSALQPLWLKQTGNSALLQTTVTRTDEKATTTNRESQPMAGIRISDGTHSGYIGIRANSIVANDAWYEHILSREYFVTWTADTNKPAMVDFLVKDNKVQIYIDGIFAKEVALSSVAPGIANNANVAVGLLTESSGKNASIKYSDVAFTTDAAKIKEFIISKDPTASIPEDSIFAGRVTVNGNTIDSVVPVWDITKIMDNTVVGNNGSALQPLWLKQIGNAALLQTTVTRTDEKATTTNRESQPMAGIRISDGAHSGYIGIRANSIVANDAWYEHILGKEYFVTWTADTNKPALVDFLVKDNKVQIYIDGIFAKEVALSTVVPGVANNANVAVGLLTESSGKNASIKYSDVAFTTDAAKIKEFIISKDPSAAIPSDSIFAGKVNINGKTVASSISNWDISKIEDNIVRASSDLSSKQKPFYFAKTGKNMQLSMHVAVTSDTVDNPTAGLWISDGTHDAFIGLYANKMMFSPGDDTYVAYIEKYWTSAPLAPNNGGPTEVDLDFTLNGGALTITVNKTQSKTISLADDLKISSDSGYAFGLVARNDSTKKFDVTFSKVSFEITSEASLGQFAQSVSLNSKTLYSSIPSWDVTNVNSNVVIANNSNSLQPLWFKQTGNTSLVKTTVTRVDTKSTTTNRETQPMAGIRISDGTHSGYIGVRANSIVVNDVWYEHILSKEYFVTWTSDTNKPAFVDFVIKDKKVKVYIDGIFAKEFALSSVVPGIANNANVAVGLVSESSGKNAIMKYSDVQFTTDAAAVNSYLS